MIKNNLSNQTPVEGGTNKYDFSDTIAETADQTKPVSRFHDCNTYRISKISVNALKAVLSGNFNVMPTVNAAKEEPPKRPPKMKVKELPMYERPHFEYKQYKEDECLKCLGENKKILQDWALPTVAAYRQANAKKICEIYYFLKDGFVEAKANASADARNFVAYMRKPENILQRKIFFFSVLGMAYYKTRKSRIWSEKLLVCVISGLLAGALTFPEDTDTVFCFLCSNAAKVFLFLYNLWYGTNVGMPKEGPCPADKPPVPPKRTIPAKYACPQPKPPPPPPKPKPPPKVKLTKVCVNVPPEMVEMVQKFDQSKTKK